MSHKYPDDGGLKEPVRDFNEGFDGFAMIRKHFTMQRIEPDPLCSGHQFRITRIPYLFYRADNQGEVAGHVRLFADRPGRGWCLYYYNQMNPDSALKRVWNFGLFCIHHVQPDKKATDPAGWHIRWASLKFTNSHRSFTMTVSLADTFKCKKEPSRKAGSGLKRFFS
jgi:hypothetical protein